MISISERKARNSVFNMTNFSKSLNDAVKNLSTYPSLDALRQQAEDHNDFQGIWLQALGELQQLDENNVMHVSSEPFSDKEMLYMSLVCGVLRKYIHGHQVTNCESIALPGGGHIRVMKTSAILCAVLGKKVASVWMDLPLDREFFVKNINATMYTPCRMVFISNIHTIFDKPEDPIFRAIDNLPHILGHSACQPFGSVSFTSPPPPRTLRRFNRFSI